MTKRGSSDPRPLLAVFACACAYALWRVLSKFDPHRVLEIASSLAPFALGALAIASALATHRIHATRRTLGRRRAVAVVPADEFDAEPDAVLGFAAQLASSERSIGGWTDRRASAVRIRLSDDGAGRLVYLLEVPERSAAALRTALRAYRGVELRPAEEVLGTEEEAEEEEKRKVVRAELRLARPSVEPLARLGPRPDPLQPFAAAIGALRAGTESAEVCVDLLPTSGLRKARLRGALRSQARRIHRERPRLGSVLEEPERGRRLDPEGQLQRRKSVQALDSKLHDSGELFEAQILLRCEAPGRARAKVAMEGLLAAFRPLADRNHLRVAGLGLVGLAFAGSDLPLRRARFDRRFATGLHRPARRTLLTASELAGLLKPPTVHCESDAVLRSGALLGAAPALADFDPAREDLIPLGKVSTEAGERLVGVRAAETFFTYVAGRSRYGKTEIAIAQFAHLMRSGGGGLFLDPHGDALERIEPHLGAEAERIVRIDLGPGSDPRALPGWNVFELGADDGDGQARAEAIVDAFASAQEWGERSTRAINLTTQAAGALAAIAARVGPESAPTIFQLPTLLGDAAWREAVVPFLPEGQRGFWTERFPLLGAEAITPVTNLVDRLHASPATRALLGQGQSAYRAREAMAEGKIVLACPGAGGTRERLVANLLLFDLLHAARSRAATSPERRRPFWLFLDEVQSYDGAASGNLAALLEQSAKFGVRAVLVNQDPERLQPATLNALTTNRSHLLASALNSRAASLIAKEWGGEPAPAALTRLQRFRFIAQVTHEGSLSAPFALGGVRVEDVVGEAEGEKPRGASAPKSAQDAAKAERDLGSHLDGLDERILAALRGEQGAPSPASSVDRKKKARAPRRRSA